MRNTGGGRARVAAFRAALALAACASGGAAGALGQDATPPAAGNAVNDANNPLTPKITLNLQDYFLPSLNRLDGRMGNQTLLRGLVPSDAFGIPQVIRFTLPVVTTPAVPTGTTTRLGDLTLFDLAVVPTHGLLLGAGPLLVVPTATSRATGAGKWQAGAAAVAVAPEAWGLLAALVTYQHSFAGDDDRERAEVFTAQPILTYNLPDGYYLRSTGLWSFDVQNRTSVVPVGFGAGKVWVFGHGNTVNAFVEPQYSAIHSGIGVPVWQIFAGVNLQIALGGP